MTGKTSWTVKGVDSAAREVAKRQARKAGITIGAWLNETIENTQRQPEAAAPRDADTGNETRLDVEALSTRLELLEARLAETTGAVERSLQNVEMSVVSGFAELDRRLANTRPQGNAVSQAAPQPRVFDLQPKRRGWKRPAALAVTACLGVAVIGGGAAVPSGMVADWLGAAKITLTDFAPATQSGDSLSTAAVSGLAEAETPTPAELAALAPAAGKPAKGDEATAAAAAASADLPYRQAVRLLEDGQDDADTAQAEALLEAAGRQGHVTAQLRLAELYLTEGRPSQDMERGLFWLMKAASAGEPTAEYRLALLYASGGKVARNYRQAATWFHRAADQGHVDAQYNLGLLYQRGIGVKRNMRIAHEWFDAAAKNGDAEATRRRDEVALLMAASDSVRADALPLSGNTIGTGWSAPLDRLPRVAADAGDRDVLRELAPLLGRGPAGSADGGDVLTATHKSE